MNKSSKEPRYLIRARGRGRGVRRWSNYSGILRRAQLSVRYQAEGQHSSGRFGLRSPGATPAPLNHIFNPSSSPPLPQQTLAPYPHTSSTPAKVLSNLTREMPGAPGDAQMEDSSESTQQDTQPSSQSLQQSVGMNAHLWGSLIPCSTMLNRIDLWKSKSLYCFGRAATNDLTFPGAKISARYIVHTALRAPP